MKFNALDTAIISRKKLIKAINALRKERMENMNKEQTPEVKEYIKVLNARLSEKWSYYNDLIKTQKLLEDSGMVPTIQ